MTSMTSITAQDYLNEQEQLENEAREILPYKADTCSHDLEFNGTPKPIRQPIYLCRTCGLNKGVCVGCSIVCHGNHDLLELFPKRNFVCDCPTSRYDNVCSLKKFKVTYTPYHQNQYNHNFIGKFCACDNYYDPMDCDQDMYQCLVCEDWFHELCLNLRLNNNGNDNETIKHNNENLENNIDKNENNDDDDDDDDNEDAGPTLRLPRSKFDDFICSECVLKPQNKLLRRYAGTSSFVMLETSLDDSQSKKRPLDDNNDGSQSHPKRLKDEHGNNISVNQSINNNECIIPEPHLKSQDFINNLMSKPLVTPPSNEPRADLFLLYGWKDHLCKCSNCIKELEHYPYLLHDEFTYEPTEDVNESKYSYTIQYKCLLTTYLDKESIFELGLKALEKLPREKALDGVAAYEKMRSNIKGFLTPFANNGKTVSENDIKAFFEEEKKKRENK